jgi:hypothetical protein
MFFASPRFSKPTASIFSFRVMINVSPRERKRNMGWYRGEVISGGSGGGIIQNVVDLGRSCRYRANMNIICSGLTNAKQLCIFVGRRKAISMAVKPIDNRH